MEKTFIKFDKVVEKRSLSARDIITLMKNDDRNIVAAAIFLASGMQKVLKMGPPFRINR